MSADRMLELVPCDARESARADEYRARITDAEFAAALAAALAGEAPR